MESIIEWALRMFAERREDSYDAAIAAVREQMAERDAILGIVAAKVNPESPFRAISRAYEELRATRAKEESTDAE